MHGIANRPLFRTSDVYEREDQTTAQQATPQESIIQPWRSFDRTNKCMHSILKIQSAALC